MNIHSISQATYRKVLLETVLSWHIKKLLLGISKMGRDPIRSVTGSSKEAKKCRKTCRGG